MNSDQITGWIFKLQNLYRESLSEKGLSLKECVIRVSPLKGRLGEWSAADRSITISENLLCEGSWSDIRHVLLHETAHQIVDELFCRRALPHGELFAEACRTLGISPQASYSLTKVSANPAVRRIEKLMALSKSSNENEAVAALSKAQKLSFKYNVDILNSPGRSYSLRPLGRIRRRTPSYEWKLINILTEFYFVKALHIYHEIDSKLHWQFELYGTSQNIDSAEYVYGFLNNQAENLWQEYRTLNGKSVSRKRNIFINGLYEGFRSRLEKEREELKNRYAVVHVSDPELEIFFKKCNPKISHRKISYRIDETVYQDGVADGRDITIHPGIDRDKPAALLEG